MDTIELRYDALNWLYGRYKKYPTGINDLRDFFEDAGIKENGFIQKFGEHLKRNGWVTSYSGAASGTFFATISVKGIDLISQDIKKATIKILEKLKQGQGDESILKLAGFTTGEFQQAYDLANYLQDLRYITCRFTEEDVLCSITTEGLEYCNDTVLYNLRRPEIRKQKLKRRRQRSKLEL